jgi:recombination protein U
MEDFEQQGGVAFIILFFTQLNETYYIPFKDIKKFYDRSITGGRKSFTYDEIDKNYLLKSSTGALIHYLEGISRDLESREN